jgi:16S rRNA (guanine966-N2)-methyltransferase
MEALSRGAASAVFVEQQHIIAGNLREQLNLLKTAQAQVVETDALSFLRDCTDQFNIIFLDPPYDSELLLPACELLEQRGLLRPDARIYLETRDPVVLARLPANWRVLRSKRAGQVSYHLLQREAAMAMVN